MRPAHFSRWWSELGRWLSGSS